MTERVHPDAVLTNGTTPAEPGDVLTDLFGPLAAVLPPEVRTAMTAMLGGPSEALAGDPAVLAAVAAQLDALAARLDVLAGRIDTLHDAIMHLLAWADRIEVALGRIGQLPGLVGKAVRNALAPTAGP